VFKMMHPHAAWIIGPAGLEKARVLADQALNPFLAFQVPGARVEGRGKLDVNPTIDIHISDYWYYGGAGADG